MAFAAVGVLLPLALVILRALAGHAGHDREAANPEDRLHELEAALRRSEAKFESLVMGSIAGMIVHRDRRILFANPALARLLGYDDPAELMRAETVDVFVAPEERDRLRRYADARMRGEPAPDMYAARGLTRDGQEVWVNMLNKVVQWEGQPAILSTMYDITEQKRTEASLRRSEEKFRSLIEGSNQAIVVHRERRILFANRAYAEMYGYGSLDEVLADGTLDSAIAPEERERLRSFGAARMRGEDVPPLYYSQGLRKDGRRIWVYNLNDVIEWEGQPAIFTAMYDITEFKEAIDQQARDEEKFRSLIEGSIQGIAIHRNRRILFANRAFAAMFGHDSVEDVLALPSIDELTAPEEREHTRALASARIRGEPAVEAYEIQGLRKDGTRIWINSLNNVIVWEGEPAILSTSYDVTERKRAEGALRQSEAKFRSLIEGSIQGIVIHRNGRPVFANKAMARIFGYTGPQEILALPSLSGTIAPEDRERLERYGVARRHGENVPNAYVFRGVRKDGRRIWLSNLSHMVDWDGEPATLATVFDITDAKEAEEALRLSEKRYRELTEQATDGIHVVRLDGRFVDTNTAGHEMFGYTRAEFLTLGVPDVTDTDDLRARPFSADLLRPGETRTVVRRLVRKDGSRFPGEISSRRMDNDTILAFIRDISEREALEAQLLQAQKMEAIGQLTGGVAHDFNNLLAVILGNLELMDQDLRDRPQLHTLVQRAIEAVNRGSTLTQRLLAFSRKQLLQPRPIDLNELVLGVAEMLQRTLEESIAFDTLLQPGLWATEVDPVQLETVLLNLVLNARDAMPGGGRLTIGTENRLLEPPVSRQEKALGLASGRYVYLSVRDTGHGMSPDTVQRVFEPFFTTKEVGRGSGLGLSMVYGFVTQSGGRIHIDSEPGCGTTVGIHLPAFTGSAGEPAPQQERPQAYEGNGQRILVVEDDTQLRVLAVQMIESLGYRPLAASDAESALALLERSTDVALLFTDVVLPGPMSGIALAKEARRRQPALKVIYTSGYPKPALEPYIRPEGIVDLLEKPYNKAVLARALRSTLDGDPQR